MVKTNPRHPQQMLCIMIYLETLLPKSQTEVFKFVGSRAKHPRQWELRNYATSAGDKPGIAVAQAAVKIWSWDV